MYCNSWSIQCTSAVDCRFLRSHQHLTSGGHSRAALHAAQAPQIFSHVTQSRASNDRSPSPSPVLHDYQICPPDMQLQGPQCLLFQFSTLPPLKFTPGAAGSALTSKALLALPALLPSGRDSQHEQQRSLYSASWGAQPRTSKGALPGARALPSLFCSGQQGRHCMLHPQQGQRSILLTFINLLLSHAQQGQQDLSSRPLKTCLIGGHSMSSTTCCSGAITVLPSKCRAGLALHAAQVHLLFYVRVHSRSSTPCRSGPALFMLKWTAGRALHAAAGHYPSPLAQKRGQLSMLQLPQLVVMSCTAEPVMSCSSHPPRMGTAGGQATHAAWHI